MQLPYTVLLADVMACSPVEVADVWEERIITII
jgi:hypothetical protein